MKFKATGKHSVSLFQGSPKLTLVTSEGKTDPSQFAGEMPPGVSPTPKPEDFFEFMFRHLSATVVGSGSWKASDFTNEDVLKAAVPLLRHKPAYTNHYIAVGNEIGHIGEPMWKAAVMNDGVLTPGGIEAPFVLDCQLQPKLVRQLNSPVSPVTCCSVTVNFDWVASHEFENEYDFFRHLGEQVDGTEVRRIATKITDFFESSLVWRGADPYARRLTPDGKISEINITEDSDDEGGMSAERIAKTQSFYVVSGPIQRRTASFEAPATPPKNEHGSPIPMNEKFLIALAAALGLTVEQVKAADESTLSTFKIAGADAYGALEKEAQAGKTAQAQITSLTAAKDTAEQALATATTQVTSLTKERDELTAEKTTLAPLVATGRAFEASLRRTAEAQYTKFLKGGTADPAILEELKTSSVAALEAKVTMWGGAVVAEFAPTCSQCASAEHITFRSSVADPDNLGGGHEEEEVNMAHLARQR